MLTAVAHLCCWDWVPQDEESSGAFASYDTLQFLKARLTEAEVANRQAQHSSVFASYMDIANHYQGQHDYQTVRQPLHSLPPSLFPLLPHLCVNFEASHDKLVAGIIGRSMPVPCG